MDVRHSPLGCDQPKLGSYAGVFLQLPNTALVYNLPYHPSLSTWVQYAGFECNVQHKSRSLFVGSTYCIYYMTCLLVQ